MKRQFGRALLLCLILISVSISVLSVPVSAVNCWDQSTQVTCEASSDCQWMEDPWGSWCEEMNCWSLYSDTSCGQASNASSSSFINRSCTWRDATDSSWCNQANCWSYAGTDQATCESNTAGLACEWSDTYNPDNGDYPCFPTSGNHELDCWQYTTSTACGAVTGCDWGDCFQESCWDFNNQVGCEAATGYNGQSCKWDPQYSNCYESGCWDYSTTSTCESNGCKWDNGYCSEPFCPDYSFTDQNTCENNVANISCNWDSFGQFCNDEGCWNNPDQGSCEGSEGCSWDTFDSGGWCEEAMCWSFDNISMNGAATESSCVNNSAGITCSWDQNGGWCYEDFSSLLCSDIGNDKECFDTNYCMWNFTDTTCVEPPQGGFGEDFGHWNPGCFIFDYSQTDCESVSGCSWTNGVCESNATIAQDGLTCGSMTNSTMCNDIPALNTCCGWQAGICAEDQFSTACWDQMDIPPAYSCEDEAAFTDQSICEQISGSPWFMPCRWDNSTERCEIKFDDMFDEGKENLMFLENEQQCGFAGGRWVSETYCEGSIAVSTGRCEPMFDEERNCDKACFACEFQSDGTFWSSSVESKQACVGSASGMCEFNTDATAPNGHGFCDVKNEFQHVLGGKSCDDDCGACTYMGDAFADTSENRPSQFCRNSNAGCKWMPDLTYPTDESMGRCSPESEKSCADRCDRCYDEGECLLYGQKEGDSAAATQCSWDPASAVSCQPQNGAGELEVCFDGEDNNDNGDVDCADSMCFSDPFCGGNFFGDFDDCFSYDNQTECDAGNCSWIDEDWGSWCDMPGADCWSYDGTNQSNCEAQGCEWSTGNGGFCEMDESGFEGCFSLNSTTCTGNCTWMQDSWCQDVGGWCENDPAYNNIWVDCWQLYGQPGQIDSTGCDADAACRWQEDQWCAGQGANAGWCEFIGWSCWNYNTQASCTNISAGLDQWCAWDQFSNNCFEREDNVDCWNINDEGSCNSSNSTNGCYWVNGLCDPPGFGENGGMMCWMNDGNETGCNATTGCGWFAEHQPFCDVDWSADCGQYWDNTTCAADDRCEWGGSWCQMKVDDCYQIGDQGTCDGNSHCSWQGSWCEPKCWTGGSNQGTCDGINIEGTSTSACRWITGWCGGAMAAEYFGEMESGAPIMLGEDATGDSSADEVDIAGFGMKDLGDAYGFGTGVVDLRDAAFCNGVNTPNGPGTGANTTKFYFYLDTDGDDTNNCDLLHDNTSAGYEFHFVYESEWNDYTNALDETYTSYRCSDDEFAVSDIKVTSFKQFMCDEIGGGMVAVDKSDLEGYPDLYTAGVDMRVSVSTAGEDGNSSSPDDTASSGYMTPGTQDFDLDSLDLFRLTEDGMNFGQADSHKGYVEYDSDCWTTAGCADYECFNHPYCTANSLGVHAVGFEDTRTPKIIAITKEEYPDSAFITYFTDKPSNGTLSYYGTDSSCTTQVGSFPDIGVTSNYSREFKLWHLADITGLSADTEYYYKLNICDDAGKCGVSKCSRIHTEPDSNCPFCRFVARIKAPTGWTVSYDTDQNSVYEHEQGQVCGANAGMKINYSDAQGVNIRLAKSDNTTWIEFINAHMSKSGLHSKTGDIDESGALGAGTTTDTSGNTIGYAGMISSTRDKIVNNLFPERCRIKIPGTGTCDELWHCNDDMDTCVDRTNESTLLENASTYCIWELPYCEFSTWAGGEPSTGSSGSSGSSGGGGGGGGGGSTVASGSVISLLPTGGQILVKLNNAFDIDYNGVLYGIKVTGITSDSVIFQDLRTMQIYFASMSFSRKYDLDGNGRDDTIIDIVSTAVNKATLMFSPYTPPERKWLSFPSVEKTTAPDPVVEESAPAPAVEPAPAPEPVAADSDRITGDAVADSGEGSGLGWAIALMLVVAVGIGVALFVHHRPREPNIPARNDKMLQKIKDKHSPE